MSNGDLNIVISEGDLEQIASSVMRKFNPNHGPDGRFTSGGGGGGSGKTKPGGLVSEAQGSMQSSTLFSAIKEKGGFTYQPLTNKSPKGGFAVSPFRDAEMVINSDKISSKAIFDYLKKHRQRFKDPRVHVGGWHDTEAKKVYLDLSVVEKSKKKAIKVAKEHGQEGIYDLGRGKTIIVKEESERRKSSSGSSPIVAMMDRPESEPGKLPSDSALKSLALMMAKKILEDRK